MNRTTSLYLDAVRCCAALVVVLTHLAYPRFSGGLLLGLRTYGNDAVMVFFVLSGYVIAYTATNRDHKFGDYVLNRLARLYSVALPAVLLTWLLDHLGQQLNPGLYHGFWYQGDHPLRRMFAALTFTHELWLQSVRLFSNGPYWSLGYEFWYYALFAAGCYFHGWRRCLLLLLTLVVMGPKILLLLPVWLLGLWVSRVNQRGRVGAAAGSALFLGSILLYIGLRATGLRDLLLDWTYLQLGQRFVRLQLMWSDEFLSSYIIGLLVAANFIGFHALSKSLAGFMARGQGVIRTWAAATFSIYLFHYPLLQFFAALFRLEPRSPVAIAVLFVATVWTCRILARFTEQRKSTVRRLLQYSGGEFARLIRRGEMAWRAPRAPS